MDMMEAFHIFATQVAESLNQDPAITPLEGFTCSVLVVLAKENVPEPFPMGGSLNYDEKTKQWYVTEQMAEVRHSNG
jgi:hypothetical protein